MYVEGKGRGRITERGRGDENVATVVQSSVIKEYRLTSV